MINSDPDKEELVVYELCFLILPSISEDKIAAVVEVLKKIVAKTGGLEIDQEMPFKQPLAYPISKTVGASRYVLSEAYLGWFKFEVEPAEIQSIKAEVEKMSEILRFLIIKASRETTFTFAQARAAIKEEKEKEREAAMPVEEAVLE